jgi:hypothetical protein
MKLQRKNPCSGPPADVTAPLYVTDFDWILSIFNLTCLVIGYKLKSNSLIVEFVTQATRKSKFGNLTNFNTIFIVTRFTFTGLLRHIKFLTLIRCYEAETREITLRPEEIRYFFNVQLHSLGMKQNI